MKPNPVWVWKAYWPISVYYLEMDDVFIKHNDKKWAVCHMVPISIASASLFRGSKWGPWAKVGLP